MVTLQILVLPFLVRVRVAQQRDFQTEISFFVHFLFVQVTEIRLLAIFNGSSVENYYSMRLFIAKGNSLPRAEGQRWEAQ